MHTRFPITFEHGRMLAATTDCRCGRRHELPFDSVVVDRNALASIPEVLLSTTGTRGRCCLVADANTLDVAGRTVETLLRSDGWSVTESCFPSRGGVKPDEAAVGAVMMDMPPDTDVFVAVGSGCLTDITRLAAARTGRPWVSVATAPSVDAYTSDTSPMIVRGVKRSLAGVPARHVLADTEVLASAPQAMVASGFGDTVGKLISRCDWQLSALVTGEYFCPDLAEAVTTGVMNSTERAAELGHGDGAAIRVLAESLMVSGAAMTVVGNSRPASGSEHFLSHFWEMKAMYRGDGDHLHGTKVGVGTVVMAEFWGAFARRLAGTDPLSLATDPSQLNRRSAEETRVLLQSNLGPAAEILLTEVTERRKLSPAARRARLERMQSVWSGMREIAAQAPAPQQLRDQLHSAGGPALPSEIGVDAEALRDTLHGALEVRDRFTVLTAAEELGWLDAIVAEVVDAVAR